MTKLDDDLVVDRIRDLKERRYELPRTHPCRWVHRSPVSVASFPGSLM